jgi:hypothetical protein
MPCWLRLEQGQEINACSSLCKECFDRDVVLPDEVQAETRAWWRPRLGEEASD